MKKRCLAGALALALALSLALPAHGVTQAEIDALEAKRDEIRARQVEVTEQLESLHTDRDSLMERKRAMDEQNELLREDIVLIEEQIAVYEGVITEKQAEVEEAREEEEAQFSRYRYRVRAMEERGTWSYLAFLLDAASLTDLLSRLNDVSDILANDKNLRTEYVNAREKAEAAEQECEQFQEQQVAKREELEAQKAELEAQITATGRLIAQLEDDIEFYEEFSAQVQAEQEAIQSEIDEKAAELKRQQEEEARRQAAQQAASGGGGGAAASTYVSNGYYAWPANTTYITSPFGYRIHPIYGTSRLHSGVDIGAAYGTAVTAAASGSVISAVLDYGTTGYGTYVAIYHDNGTVTLYGHMSSLAVSEGQYVSQGDVIGYVGSTGAATGPHLHFEVRVDGACVDPMQYFS